MKALRALLPSVAVLFSPPLHALDLSDLWWNSHESGWGVNVAHQGDILFMTFFVYGQSGQPLWLVAPSTQYQTTSSAGTLVYSGPLYQTSGPWFGAPFDPNAVSAPQVGTATFTATSVTAGTLSYSVNGVPVTKSVTRQTFRNNANLAGNYLGGLVVYDYSGCGAQDLLEGPMLFSVSLSGSSMSLMLGDSSYSCTVTGAYVQSGRMGAVQGPISCTEPVFPATVTVYEIEANGVGVAARFSSRDSSGCSFTARIAGVRR